MKRFPAAKIEPEEKVLSVAAEQQPFGAEDFPEVVEQRFVQLQIGRIGAVHLADNFAALPRTGVT